MASDKSSSNQAKADSPRSIAHDLANLLQVIDGFVKMAKDDAEKDSSVAKCLDEILTASNRAYDLLPRIRSISEKD
jgi:signal transduction histidine kinase